MSDRIHRVKLKFPAGTEFEAEGSPEFVERERKEFLARMGGQAAEDTAIGGAPLAESGFSSPNIAWTTIMESQGRNLQLRAKLPREKSEKDACLVLMACSQKLLNQAKPTATQLAKWLRRSGYPVQRMDRALQDAVAQGEILSSGSRRARRYELTASGRMKAYILANQLSKAVTGQG